MSPRTTVGFAAIAALLLWIIVFTYGVVKGILFYLGIEVSASALFPFVTTVIVPALIALGIYRGYRRLMNWISGK